MEVKWFDFDRIIKGDVLYLEDDASLSSNSFNGCDDDITWAEWENYTIRKIVVGKEVTEFPVEMIAEQRRNKPNSFYEVEIDDHNPCFTYHDGGIYDKGMYHLIFFAGKAEDALTIPEGVLKIGDFAFENYSNLRSVEFPRSLTEIGSCAFSKCRSLLSVTIPDSDIQIEDDAFEGIPQVIFKGNACDEGRKSAQPI